MPPKVKNYLIVLLAAATVSSSLIAWNQNRLLTALQQNSQRSALPAKPRPAPVAAAPISSDSDATKAVPEEVDPVEPEDAPEQAAEAPQRSRRNRPNFAALMADPEFAGAMKVQQRAALDRRYADLFKQLNLSPAELEKFKDLLVERQAARMDVMIAARESGLNPRENREELRKLTQEAQAEVDAHIKAALGEARFDQYQNYDATRAQRNVVNQLDQRLSYSSTPLNSTQSAFLVNALASASEQTQATSDNRSWNNRPVITDMLIEQARSVLTADQITALKQLQSEQQAQQRVRDMMRNSSNR